MISFKEFLQEAILDEAVIPHPQYGKFHTVGVNKYPKNDRNRIEIVFGPAKNAKHNFHVHISGTDRGETFVWLTDGEDGTKLEFRKFKKLKKMYDFLQKRFGIRLNSWGKVSGLVNYVSKMDKSMRKQMVEV